jgi:hypothetical protein
MNRSGRALATVMTATALTSVAIGVRAAGSDRPAIARTHTSTDTVGARPYEDLSAIADYARAHGLSGLSPVSLHPVVNTSPYDDLWAIADYARAHGLSGLSPASLTPVITRDATVETAAPTTVDQ